MNFLLLDGLIWKAVKYIIPHDASGAVIDVTDKDLRSLERYMPGVGYRPEAIYIMQDPFERRLLYHHVSEDFVPYRSTPFRLGMAADNPTNVVAEFEAYVDDSGPDWNTFTASRATPAREWDAPEMYKLPLILRSLGHQAEDEDLCHS